MEILTPGSIGFITIHLCTEKMNYFYLTVYSMLSRIYNIKAVLPSYLIEYTTYPFNNLLSLRIDTHTMYVNRFDLNVFIGLHID